MNETQDPSEKLPPLYETRSVPFEKLSADEFEKCVFACFLTIQSHQGLRIDGRPAGSGDGGFDVYGIALSSNRKLCIQCKRQKASLGLTLLAKEVAKVAMTSRLGESDVGVHFFICSGGVTLELRRLLRETERTKILKEAQLVIREAKEGELHSLRERITEIGENAEDVVGSYVRNLERLVAWDMEEFDAALSPVWDTAFTVLERYFRISTAVREHSRALFTRQTYLERCGSFTAVIEPQLEEGTLPSGLVEFSGVDPGPQKQPQQKKLLTVKSLTTLAPGEVVIVVAEGGAGKTTLLELVRAEVARELSNSTLSVLINCADYELGALDILVQAQLGVKSGSWRMLPDKIQILCDGINEAPSEKVKALFAELKPLLMSNCISCIFTSRKDSRTVRTVLPSIPCATLSLLPLTPGRVRALAKHELVEESEVAAFSDAHRVMAARTAGHFMWTPFAVRTALKYWKNCRKLGDTLGDLLDTIVLARAERDLEIPSQGLSTDLPRTSVVAIASALAFEMLVVDGSTTCSACTIVATIKRAMQLCSNVLGTDGLNSNRLIGLLRKHDLVQQTPDDSFLWNHQLVAGALAAPHLASKWRQHLFSLKQPIADDAWVFATRLVSEPDLDEYLRELFHADLMLGARATAELPLANRNRSLQYIFKALEPGQPEALQATGFFALSLIGTEDAVSFLKKTEKDQQSSFRYVAAKALAFSGDRQFLLNLLAEVDKCRRAGWGMSGGIISIWESASLADRIAIARERLLSVAPGQPVNESLNLISIETSQEDLSLIETHLHAAKDITAWGVALRAISKGDHDIAQSLLEQELSQATDSKSKAMLMTMGHRVGLHINVEEAFSVLMDLTLDETEDHSILVAKMDLTTDVIGELQLPITISRQIEDQLVSSSGEKALMFWELARYVGSPEIALIALESLVNDQENAGMAANFFLAHQTLQVEHHSALQAAIERFLQNKANWFTFSSYRILVLAAELGVTSRTVTLLQKMILRLSELLEFAQCGTIPVFEESEAHIAKDFKSESASYHLERYAFYLVPGAVGARELLPKFVLLKFLHFNLDFFAHGMEIANVYREMDSTLLDDELELVRDAWAQRAGLEMLCEFGLTDRRLELIRNELRENYCHPAALNSIKKALEKCWNAGTCKMVVETVANLEEWPEQYHQFFWGFNDMVTERLTNTDRTILEYHLLMAKTAFAQRILRIWHQATLDSRVGLSRLEA